MGQQPLSFDAGSKRSWRSPRPSPPLVHSHSGRGRGNLLAACRGGISWRILGPRNSEAECAFTLRTSPASAGNGFGELRGLDAERLPALFTFWHCATGYVPRKRFPSYSHALGKLDYAFGCYNPRNSNPHRRVARPYVPLGAVSSLGGFRTPAAESAAPSLKRPASETLHES